MQIDYSLVLNDSETDAVKAAVALYAEKCKTEGEAGNRSPYSANVLKTATLTKKCRRGRSFSAEPHDLRPDRLRAWQNLIAISRGI
jgi:hypothetical protein